MSYTQVPEDNEIDLFEVFEILWDGRWLIGGFVALSLIVAISSLFIVKAEYSSRLIYFSDTLPPFYGSGKALSDFRKKFYDKATFNLWLSNNPETTIQYEEFSNTEIVEGFILSKNEENRLALFDSEKNKKRSISFVLVKSNELSQLNDFYSYAQYINTLLSEQYIQRSKHESVLIENKFKEFPSAANSIINNLLVIDRYIDSASRGARILYIARPTMPEKISPKPALILVVSVILGGIIGVFYVLVRNAVRKRKEQLANT